MTTDVIADVRTRSRGFIPSLVFLCTAGISLLMTGFTTAQSPTFTATLSSTVVYQNDIFSVSFELAQAEGTGFTPPDFAGLKLVSGPAIGASTTIINGVRSQSRSWSYSILAPKPGKYVIGAASVKVDGKTMTTKPLSLEVLAVDEKSKKSKSIDDVIRLRAEMANGPIYPGQQVRLDYRLLYRDNIQNIGTMVEDDYSAFYVQGIINHSREVGQEMVGNTPYASRIYKSIVLFPHQSGTYTIDPMLVRAGIRSPSPGGGFGFFQMHRVVEVEAVSKPLDITVLPLPAGAPTDFSGGVGQFSISAAPSGRPIGNDQVYRLTTDEAFTLAVQITGNGDIRRWEVPACHTDGDFDQYAPKIEEEKYVSTGEEIIYTRHLTYTMIPQSEGRFNIYVPFIYFDPALRSYLTISTDTFTLEITRGTGMSAVTPGIADHSTHVTLMPVRKALLPDRFWTSPIHLILFSIVVVGAGTSALRTIRRQRESAISREERIRRNAAGKALNALDDLEGLADQENRSTFFEKATLLYHHFLIEQLGIPPGELDSEKLSRYLMNSGVDADLSNEIIRLFEQSLVARYAGYIGGQTPREILTAYRDVIMKLTGKAA